MAALFNRERTGEGEYIDISMVDTLISMDCAAHPNVAATRGAFHPQRDGRAHFLKSPWGVFKGPSERYFATVGDSARLCEALECRKWRGTQISPIPT
jgi:CoA:oxalate CoA-transferase